MQEQFLNHIRQHNLCEPGSKVLLAVSGGLDSIAMLHLFNEAGFSTGVAHCNFQLRGSESDGDELFVKQQCEVLKVPFHSKQFETESYSKQNGISIQMAARELRYAWFDELLDRHGYDYVATAHHFNDSIETILLNWIHGASLENFSGIPVKNNRIIRPLLFSSRTALEQFVKEKNLTWREDSSNGKDDYQRNFIRHQVIPKLKEINPALEATLERGLRKIKDELFLLENSVSEWKQKHFSAKGTNTLIAKTGILNPTVLWKVIKEYGFNFDQCEDVFRSLNGQPGKRFLSPGYQLIIDREQLIVSPHEKFWDDVVINEGQEDAILGSWDMYIEKHAPEFSTDSHIAILDAGKLRFPLRWRKWKAGDFFYPLGMDHKRKISDFLIDNKVPVSDKNVVTVLESAGEIVWVVGYRIDNRFKITPQTSEALSFSIQPYFV